MRRSMGFVEGRGFVDKAGPWVRGVLVSVCWVRGVLVSVCWVRGVLGSVCWVSVCWVVLSDGRLKPSLVTTKHRSETNVVVRRQLLLPIITGVIIRRPCEP